MKKSFFKFIILLYFLRVGFACPPPIPISNPKLDPTLLIFPGSPFKLMIEKVNNSNEIIITWEDGIESDNLTDNSTNLKNISRYSQPRKYSSTCQLTNHWNGLYYSYFVPSDELMISATQLTMENEQQVFS